MLTQTVTFLDGEWPVHMVRPACWCTVYIRGWMTLTDVFLNWIIVVEEDITKNCLKRFRLDVRKFAFSNGVVSDWNLLSSQGVNCRTLNTFKEHLLTELEPETVSCVLSEIVGVIWRLSLCLLMRDMSSQHCRLR